MHSTQAMRVDLINLRGAVPAGSSTGLLAEWRVGAILQAVAVRDARGQLWLEISGVRHPARVASGDERGPAHGEQLQVRVLRNSPVLALETVPAPASPDATAEVVADALRRHVPRQTSPALMLANLAWIAHGKTGSSSLPKPVVQAALNLWQAIPSADALADADTLESAVLRSGAFFESNLAASDRGTAAAVAATDLKALMLTLGRALREQGAKPAAARADTAMHAPVPTSAGPLTPLPGTPATFALAETVPQHMNELSRQTEGAVSRLSTLQIANSAQEGSSAQAMLVEIPVRHDDRASMLRLRIEREAGRERDQRSDATWTLEAALDLGAVGPLHARVTLTGHRIGVQLRAASPAFVDVLASRTTELEAMLRESGLEVDRVVCLHGLPAGDTGVKPTRLLDVRA
jgi:hypothetical protein